MYKIILILFATLLIVSPANAFMLGSDVTEMVTAPFTLHKTGDNDIPVPKSVQRAMDMFEPDDEDFDLSGYARDVQKRIMINFEPKQFEGSPNVVILFKITRRGSIASYKILKASKNALFDYAAVQAVERSAPFEILPSEYEKDVLKLQVTFTKHSVSVNCF